MNAQVQLICTRMLIVLLVHPCVQSSALHIASRVAYKCVHFTLKGNRSLVKKQVARRTWRMQARRLSDSTRSFASLFIHFYEGVFAGTRNNCLLVLDGWMVW